MTVVRQILELSGQNILCVCVRGGGGWWGGGVAVGGVGDSLDKISQNSVSQVNKNNVFYYLY